MGQHWSQQMLVLQLWGALLQGLLVNQAQSGVLWLPV